MRIENTYFGRLLTLKLDLFDFDGDWSFMLEDYAVVKPSDKVLEYLKEKERKEYIIIDTGNESKYVFEETINGLNLNYPIISITDLKDYLNNNEYPYTKKLINEINNLANEIIWKNNTLPFIIVKIPSSDFSYFQLNYTLNYEWLINRKEKNKHVQFISN